MNKVISREYVEENYIHKDTIRKLLKRAEKEYENSGESTEYNVHKNYLYHTSYLIGTPNDSPIS